MKNIVQVLMLIALSFILIGCGVSSQSNIKLVGEVPKIQSKDYAIVHIARKAGNVGCGEKFLIQIDRKDFYWIACGERIAFKIPADKEIVISQVTSVRPDHIYLEPEKGKHYYFGTDCHVVCWFDKINKSRYMDIAATCGRETIIDKH